MIVVDASLAVKLVVDEPDRDMAERWYLTRIDTVMAPDLVAVEVAQAVVRRVNARETPLTRGRDALRSWRTILDKGAISAVRMSPAQIEKAGHLAMQLGHPVKDCIYLALAIELSCDLMTCDAKFAAKARTLYPAVKLLADYGD